MIKVNAIGQTCPIPVIMTKNALKEITEGSIEVSIDNKISKENIEKFSKEMGFSFTTREENGIFFIQINKTINEALSNSSTSNDENNTIIVIASDKMGDGETALGETLMKGFIYTLTEMESLPKAILFYNKGVFLTASNETTIKDLRILEERGVEILSCGACLNFYHLENNIAVGSITNMYNIIEKQMKANKVIRP
ncbi:MULTISPECIES: sulfurtransferase-like selenium metabolism protein YedF [Cetobacterium]|uniref:sulfurtransferase-like selenium metabolism protein YedF n=1 Tax=Cetobacterium TaxID=180162 RepID=UPI00163C66C8|nr:MULTISPECIES: sulfurtransferase-like selenium metabolism protein YedF [Cetobacterium]MBC2853740.1 sulfurtransferase-like selenium metabolism protein YedF [Cetobacterium sp. 2G large]MCQ9626683.1 sulfurtransferase-like selenium metabolism protein YedF [Cetobacterium somerae]WVJ02068.1 sulfurtransferase-like selenium metabolism protein YedF [Cetobacterium somerae]